MPNSEREADEHNGHIGAKGRRKGGSSQVRLGAALKQWPLASVTLAEAVASVKHEGLDLSDVYTRSEGSLRTASCVRFTPVSEREVDAAQGLL
jgi:hypothetical protein